MLNLEALAPGLMFKSTVRNIVDCDAFVDIGIKHEALLHRTRIPFGALLKVGDFLDLEILKIEPERTHINLGWLTEK